MNILENEKGLGISICQDLSYFQNSDKRTVSLKHRCQNLSRIGGEVDEGLAVEGDEQSNDHRYADEGQQSDAQEGGAADQAGVVNDVGRAHFGFEVNDPGKKAQVGKEIEQVAVDAARDHAVA